MTSYEIRKQSISDFLQEFPSYWFLFDSSCLQFPELKHSLFQQEPLDFKYQYFGLMTAFEFFTDYTKLAEMPLLASKDLTTAKKLPPVGLDLMQEIITGLRVQCLTS